MRVRVCVSHGLADVVWDGVKWVLREARIARRWLVGRWFAGVVGVMDSVGGGGTRLSRRCHIPGVGMDAMWSEDNHTNTL